MSIQFACPGCKKRFSVKPELAGKVAQCSDCGKKIRVPQARSQHASSRKPLATKTSLVDILDDYEPPESDEPVFEIPPEIADQLELEIEAEKKKNRRKGDDPLCPSCGKKYIGSTVICVRCGFDPNVGTTVTVEKSQMGEILFSIEGRITRSEFWTYSILVGFGWGVYGIVMIILAGIFAASVWSDLVEGNLFRGAGLTQRDIPGLAIFFGLVVPNLGFLWIQMVLLIKRWHDRNKPGIWVLLSFVPVVGQIWPLVEAGCMRGTVGPNRYGSDPLGKKTGHKRRAAIAEQKPT